jgi:hypothetical protein
MRSRAPVFTLRTGLILLGLGVLAIWTWMGLSSCHSDRVVVNAKDPQSPQFAYRQDQMALLGMMADDIQELERKKQYATIYDDYSSEDFKKGISRRRFLVISNCVETYLGGLEEYDPHDLGFRREMLKNGPNKFLDVLNRKVRRMLGPIDEQMVFIPSDLNFKLNGLYWIAKDKQFLQCVAESPQREAEGQPVPEAPAGETPPSTTQAEPNAVPAADKAANKPAETGTATETTTEKNTSGTTHEPATEKKPFLAPAEPETSRHKTSTPEAPVPSPVQEMKPAEARKSTALQARPAGAGAVIDQRPTTSKAKTPAPLNGGDSTPNHAPIPAEANNAAKAVPLPITPLIKPSNEPPTPPAPH